MSTIRSSREIDRVFKSARRATGVTAILLVAKTPPGRDPLGRVAVVAGKRVGNAVVRNRAKRVLRAAAKEAGAPWKGIDAILVARPTTAGSASHTVADEVHRLAVKAQVS